MSTSIVAFWAARDRVDPDKARAVATKINSMLEKYECFVAGSSPPTSSSQQQPLKYFNPRQQQQQQQQESPANKGGGGGDWGGRHHHHGGNNADSHHRHHHHRREQQQHHPRPSDAPSNKKPALNLDGKSALVALLNKLNESNYDSIVRQILQIDAIDPEKILNKAYGDKSFVRLYGRLLNDVCTSGAVDADAASALLTVDLDRIRKTVAEFDAAARIKCDYDAFCKGNLDIAKALGINSMAVSTFKLDGPFKLRGDALGSPLKYLQNFLLELDMNDIAVQLIQQFFGTFTTAPMRHVLEKKYVVSKDAMTKRATFGIEGILRPTSSPMPSSTSRPMPSSTPTPTTRWTSTATETRPAPSRGGGCKRSSARKKV